MTSLQKVIVWVGILGCISLMAMSTVRWNFAHILCAKSCLDMLKNDHLPLVRNLTFYTVILLWFQPDGEPPHCARRVREFLNTSFNGQCIGQGGPVN